MRPTSARGRAKVRSACSWSSLLTGRASGCIGSKVFVGATLKTGSIFHRRLALPDIELFGRLLSASKCSAIDSSGFKNSWTISHRQPSNAGTMNNASRRERLGVHY